MSSELARLNSGINRLIWVIATGFVVGAVQWVIKGRLGADMLANNWKTILLRAWSVRLIVVAGILSALPGFFALVDADVLGIDPVVFAGLSALASAAAFVARILAQPGIDDG